MSETPKPRRKSLSLGNFLTAAALVAGAATLPSDATLPLAQETKTAAASVLSAVPEKATNPLLKPLKDLVTKIKTIKTDNREDISPQNRSLFFETFGEFRYLKNRYPDISQDSEFLEMGKFLSEKGKVFYSKMAIECLLKAARDDEPYENLSEAEDYFKEAQLFGLTDTYISQELERQWKDYALIIAERALYVDDPRVTPGGILLDKAETCIQKAESYALSGKKIDAIKKVFKQKAPKGYVMSAQRLLSQDQLPFNDLKNAQNYLKKAEKYGAPHQILKPLEQRLTEKMDLQSLHLPHPYDLPDSQSTLLRENGRDIPNIKRRMQD